MHKIRRWSTLLLRLHINVKLKMHGFILKIKALCATFNMNLHNKDFILNILIFAFKNTLLQNTLFYNSIKK